jgi:phosphatidate cytidylyltransferase
MTVLQQRASTATVFILVMLTGLFWNQLSFNGLFLLIMVACLWEFYGLLIEGNYALKILGIIICLALIFSKFDLNLMRTIHLYNLNAFRNQIWTALLPIVIVHFCILLVPIVALFSKSDKPFQNMGVLAMGVIYLSFPISLTIDLSRRVWLHGEPNYAYDTFIMSPSTYFTPYVVAGVLFLTWTNDTFAYLIGSKIGKTPLFPRISPKKTWEGTMGGAIVCLIVAGILGQFFKALPLMDWLVVGGLVGVFGTIGDLFESLLKRSVGVKDSGTIMPGHGGFLDRFDAFIFAIPFVYVYLSLR